MGNLLKMLTGLDAPDDVPLNLALVIATNGYTEPEARRATADEDSATQDMWMASLRSAGYFGRGRGGSSLNTAVTRHSVAVDDTSEDAGTLLWNLLREELEANENDFKHRLFLLDNAVKNYCCFRFIVTFIVLLVTKADTESKREAIKASFKITWGLTSSSSPRTLQHKMAVRVIGGIYESEKWRRNKWPFNCDSARPTLKSSGIQENVDPYFKFD